MGSYQLPSHWAPKHEEPSSSSDSGSGSSDSSSAGRSGGFFWGLLSGRGAYGPLPGVWILPFVGFWFLGLSVVVLARVFVDGFSWSVFVSMRASTRHFCQGGAGCHALTAADGVVTSKRVLFVPSWLEAKRVRCPF